ncbi:hypothetical protein P280DRAFT_534609 [Massarina eburnea CBS 473.64]|uniref:Uncharacterized protein n=1 Tax=Massarina eburnea CBS 473.64 TaxID=1395130 RepID=A0A6A6RKG8_9PLEO|nr:hypothetical protein P280DRAFT_534609 [Massarina eburnea CBS 473.64]
MRSGNDKELSTIDLDQLFDQYVETDLFQEFRSDDTSGAPSSDDISHLFELPESNGSDPFETRTLPNRETSNEHTSWRKAVHHTFEEQNPASPDFRLNSSYVYPESRGKASYSDPEFFSLDDLFELDVDEPRAISQPSTPVPRITRPSRKARSSPDRTVRHGVQKPSKRSTIATVAGKMMNPSHYRTGFQDLWTRKMGAPSDTFNLQIQANGIHSPPLSTKLPQEEHGSGFFPRDQSYTIAMSSGDATSSDLHSSNYQLTPLSSPAIDITARSNGTGTAFQFSNDGMASAYVSHHLPHGAALSALQTPPPTQRLSMGAWGAETSPNLDFSDFSASPDFQSQDPKHGVGGAGWWNDTAVNQSSTHTKHTRSNFTTTNNNTGTGTVSGLGISCDSASFPDFMSSLHHSHNPSHNPHNTRHAPSSSSRRKSSSTSTSSHAHAQPRASSSGSNVGFVNFTPSDSRKILTGVAPSGSSKTKARREKEAAERRRKLNLAAFKAVKEAGGDVSRLVEEEGGLFMLEG